MSSGFELKYFISWYPNPPDPRYWEWFDIDGLMVSFATLKGRILRKALNLGLHRFIGFKGRIFLDSGAFQFSTKGTKKSQIEVLEFQRWLDPDLVSHLDKPYVNLEKIPEERRWSMLRETIDNAKVARKWEKKNDIQIVYVIQGWSRQSLEFCAKKLSLLDASYYGLGSLYRQPTSEIIKRVKLVRKIIGWTPLHLFGVSPLRVNKTRELEEIFSLVDSFDSSTPVRAGAVKEFFDPEDHARKHINYIRQSSKACDCPVCKRFPYAINLMGLKGRQKRYNRLRAIHNAHQLIKIVKSFARPIEHSII